MLTKQYTEKQWPFTDSPNMAVYTTRDIIEKGKPVLIVTRNFSTPLDRPDDKG